MTYIYVKTWYEIISDPKIKFDQYSEHIVLHQEYTGIFNNVTHGRYAGRAIDADVCEDGWAKANDLWFPRWTYSVSGAMSPLSLESFRDDYDAFRAWDHSIDRRKKEITERLKDSFRKAFPNNYKKE
jgi:hypothetical protein